MSGQLLLVGTPLGNRGDLSPRAREAILQADLLLCEDTRSPVRLLGNEVALPPRKSCFVGNEHERVRELLEALGAGQTVAFVSEAGMPLWSDPGRLLVEAAVEAGFDLDVIPGPTAVATAVCHAGFDGPVLFLGFVARSGAERKQALERIARSFAQCVLYEAGPRVPALFRDLAGIDGVGQRRAVLARELTKHHQEVRRGTVAELAEAFGEAVRGEVSVVVEGASDLQDAQGQATARARQTLETLLSDELRPRPRARELAKLTGLDARDIYDRLRTRLASGEPTEQ